MSNSSDESRTAADEVRRILENVVETEGDADPKTLHQLLPVLYHELHTMARQLMSREAGAQTLQPTALVNEAYLRLQGSRTRKGKGRISLLEAAAVAMRRVLVDHAREVRTRKRGGDWRRVTLYDTPEATEVEDVDVEALVQALDELEAMDPRQAKIVELRFFTGLSGQEIADHLNISRNTVVRELTTARFWLKRALRPPPKSG